MGALPGIKDTARAMPVLRGCTSMTEGGSAASLAACSTRAICLSVELWLAYWGPTAYWDAEGGSSYEATASLLSLPALVALAAAAARSWLSVEHTAAASDVLAARCDAPGEVAPAAAAMSAVREKSRSDLSCDILRAEGLIQQRYGQQVGGWGLRYQN